MMPLSLNCFSSLIGSSNAIQGIGTATVTAIIVPVSCVASFIIGVLLGVMAYYCAARKKRSVTLSQLREQPNTHSIYEDLQKPGDMELKKNAAYMYVDTKR